MSPPRYSERPCRAAAVGLVAGFRAIVTRGSLQGIQLASQIGVELALVDVNLSDGDGVRIAVELCKRLPHCKILLISGDSNTTEVSVVSYLNVGAQPWNGL